MLFLLDAKHIDHSHTLGAEEVFRLPSKVRSIFIKLFCGNKDEEVIRLVSKYAPFLISKRGVR
ncbi:MAG: hypothetical protein HPY53_01645 [Brevinematales bacterium]|nr:hypothetical protein [Brevinematales bacterium]